VAAWGDVVAQVHRKTLAFAVYSPARRLRDSHPHRRIAIAASVDVGKLDEEGLRRERRKAASIRRIRSHTKKATKVVNVFRTICAGAGRVRRARLGNLHHFQVPPRRRFAARCARA